MPWELWVMVAMLVIGIPLAYHLGTVVGAEQEHDRQTSVSAIATRHLIRGHSGEALLCDECRTG